jgi:hypothetical protein
MFGTKERHEQIMLQLIQNRDACNDLAHEVNELKEMIQNIDIHHIVNTMECFVDSTAYIQHILENAQLDSDKQITNTTED